MNSLRIFLNSESNLGAAQVGHNGEKIRSGFIWYARHIWLYWNQHKR
jgi:hypothetical protein